jgi:hypothetical protein
VFFTDKGWHEADIVSSALGFANGLAIGKSGWGFSR